MKLPDPTILAMLTVIFVAVAAAVLLANSDFTNPAVIVPTAMGLLGLAYAGFCIITGPRKKVPTELG